MNDRPAVDSLPHNDYFRTLVDAHGGIAPVLASVGVKPALFGDKGEGSLAQGVTHEVAIRIAVVEAALGAPTWGPDRVATALIPEYDDISPKMVSRIWQQYGLSQGERRVTASQQVAARQAAETAERRRRVRKAQRLALFVVVGLASGGWWHHVDPQHQEPARIYQRLQASPVGQRTGEAWHKATVIYRSSPVGQRVGESWQKATVIYRSSPVGQRIGEAWEQAAKAYRSALQAWSKKT